MARRRAAGVTTTNETLYALACLWCAATTPAISPRGFCAVHQVEYDNRERQRREKEAEASRGTWLADIGVPRALRAFASFDDVEATKPVEILERYYDDGVKRGRACGLLGPTGVGKTLASVALIGELLPDFRDFMKYTLGLTLVRQLSDFDTCAEVMNRCLRVRLLVLDDLPRITEPRVAQMLEELFIVRESERRATVFTSNIPPKQLSTLLTDRVIDRLKAWGKIHAITGPSLRQPPAPEASS
jgi:DNA replication protein DnaC